jgi:PleD family two-component response regulator
VTLSIGAATVVPKAQASSVVLIEMADKALYQAKKAGRDCVVATEILLMLS